MISFVHKGRKNLHNHGSNANFFTKFDKDYLKRHRWLEAK
jgi:hypothetical protein